MGFKNLTTRFQDLEPIKRPLTASFNSNIHKVFKRGNKTKYGETPTSRSLRKLPKSGIHTKPSPRRAASLLVSKTADGRIARISREKEDSLSLTKLHFSYWTSFSSHSRFCLMLSGEDKHYATFCLFVT